MGPRTDPDRPARLVLVLGTGTEVGKTWVAARILAALRADGVPVAARKPAQSYEPADDESQRDAAVLARASGEEPADVCAPERGYEVAMAPPMAAEVLGRPSFSIGDLVAELHWPPRPAGSPLSVGLVEAAGGVYSPQAHDGDGVDLARALDPDLVVLVADAGLGTINAVRLSVAALRPVVRPLTVLNRFDQANELHRRNRSWLVSREGLDVVTLPSEESTLLARVLG